MAMELFRPTVTAEIGSVEFTDEGFLIAKVRAARSGIQLYTGDEVGHPTLDVVRVYRPPSEVFDKESVNTFGHATVTLLHPSELVTADNWEELAIGEVSTDILRDGDAMVVNIMVKAKRGLDRIADGMVEVSMGYLAEIEITDGVTPEGEKYDAIQRKPRINHLAVVPKGRAGERHRIGDSATWGASPSTLTKGTVMADLVTVVVGDKAVQVSASDADVITKMVADHKTAIDEKDTEIGTLKAENAETAAKVLDADALDELIAEHVAVADKAKSLIDGYDIAGKKIMDMQREVVGKMHSIDADVLAAMPDAQVKGVFDYATAKPADDKARKVIGDRKSPVSDAAASWAKIEQDNKWGSK